MRLKSIRHETMLGMLFVMIATAAAASPWNVTFDSKSKSVVVPMDETKCVGFYAPVTDVDIESGVLTIDLSPTYVANVQQKPILSQYNVNNSIWSSCVNISGQFLGSADLVMTMSSFEGNKSSVPLEVIVLRRERVIDRVFTGSVILLVSLLYINFGCAIDWGVCRSTMRRPVGPGIGFFSQFVCMPLVSYALAKMIFPDNPGMQIGMFFSGISPAGGASNIWTVILGGNLNLSITMTTISTIAAFAMMPFWIFTLGARIFENARLSVPYANIGEVAIGLIIPLGIGCLIQKKLPRVSKFLVRVLKPCSTLLIVAIIIFAIITNLYLFKLFSWQIIVAGMGLPWIGYVVGWLLAFFFKQPRPDVTAISIETGVHNTGIPILLLRTALTQPAADLATVVPVAIAIMTPIPLTIMFIIKSIRDRRNKNLSASAENIQGAAADPLSASIVAERTNYTS